MNRRFAWMREYFLLLRTANQSEPFDYADIATGQVATIRYLGSNSEVKVPVHGDEKDVKQISPFTFTDRTDITSVIIPNGVEELD